MLKTTFRSVMVLLVIFIAFLAGGQISETETQYPMGTASSGYVNFSTSTLSKKEILSKVNDFSLKNHSSSLLVKSDTKDFLQGLNVYWFGEQPQGASLEGSSANWFAPGRHGQVSRYTALGSLNPSGQYAFNSFQDCLSFNTWVSSWGATADPCLRKDASWKMQLKSEDGTLEAFASLMVLVCALVWMWVSNRNRLHMIMVMNGKSITRLFLGDLADLAIVTVIPLLGTWVLVGIWSLLTHSVFPWDFLILVSCTLLIVYAAVLLLTVVFSIILHPRVTQIAGRIGNQELTRAGTFILKIICLSLLLIALPVGMNGFALASSQASNAAIWRNNPDAVALSINTTSPEEDERWEGKTDDFLRSAEKMKIMGLSMSVGSVVSGADTASSNNGSSHSNTHSEFDDVVMTDEGFLKIMKVNHAFLTKVSPAELDSTLRSGIKEYDSIWLPSGSKDSLLNHLYSWKNDDSLFPSLQSTTGLTGQISKAKNPLIILVQKPAEQLNLPNFLSAALSTANVIFSNEKAVNKYIDQSGIRPIVSSVNTISDSALYESQQFENLARMHLLTVAISFVVILLSAVESARLWCIEKKKTIFLLHSNGDSLFSIVGVRCLLDLLIFLAISGICYAMGFWTSIDKALPILALVGVAYMTVMVTTELFESRRIFYLQVHREE